MYYDTYLKHCRLNNIVRKHISEKIKITLYITLQISITSYRTKSISVSGVRTFDALSTDSVRTSTIFAPCPGRIVVTRQMPNTTAEIVVRK